MSKHRHARVCVLLTLYTTQTCACVCSTYSIYNGCVNVNLLMRKHWRKEGLGIVLKIFASHATFELNEWKTPDLQASGSLEWTTMDVLFDFHPRVCYHIHSSNLCLYNLFYNLEVQVWTFVTWRHSFQRQFASVCLGPLTRHIPDSSVFIYLLRQVLCLFTMSLLCLFFTGTWFERYELSLE